MTVSLGHLSTTRIAAIDKTRAVVVQPIGAMEQHGAHLPVLTDAITSQRITERALAEIGPDQGFWMLPGLSYGKSSEHVGYAGTVALSMTTLAALCLDLGRSVAASGFRKLVFVNGHGGQPELLNVLARDIRIETGLEVFTLMPNDFDTPDDFVALDPVYGIHGGQHETSMMLALAPELVDMSLAVKDGDAILDAYDGMEHLSLYGSVPTAWVTADLSASGVIGDPTGATVELGERIVAAQVAALAQTLREIQRFSFPSVRAGRHV